jgi:hypothetical protein
MSFMAKLIRQAAAGELNDDTKLYPSRKFTREDIGRIAERACVEFRNRVMNVLSLYSPLDGSFGVYETLQNFVQTKSTLNEEINAAAQGGDEVDLIETLIKTLEFAFVTLSRKGALDRLLLTEEAWPPIAVAEWLRMEKSITRLLPGAAPASAPSAAVAPVTPVVVETPIEACVREFKETPSKIWKAKWLDNRNNRPIADQAVAEGRL